VAFCLDTETCGFDYADCIVSIALVEIESGIKKEWFVSLRDGCSFNTHSSKVTGLNEYILKLKGARPFNEGIIIYDVLVNCLSSLSFI
jgi:DNA polymerase III epsilon subunit-like protein